MYQPKHGSPTAKLIDHLSSSGEPVKVSDLSAATGVSAGTVSTLLATAMRHGLVVRTGPGVYQIANPFLGGGTARPPRARPEPVVPDPPIPSAFSVGVYSDGDVMLINPAELGEGYARLSRDQAITLLHFLGGRDIASLPCTPSALPRD